MSILLTFMFTCGPLQVVNATERPWGQRDDEVVARAEYVCKTQYAPNVCLVKLVRFDDYSYHAICGRPL